MRHVSQLKQFALIMRSSQAMLNLQQPPPNSNNHLLRKDHHKVRVHWQKIQHSLRGVKHPLRGAMQGRGPPAKQNQNTKVTLQTLTLKRTTMTKREC